MPWMGLSSAMIFAGYAILLISGDFMAVSCWFYRLLGGTATFRAIRRSPTRDGRSAPLRDGIPEGIPGLGMGFRAKPRREVNLDDEPLKTGLSAWKPGAVCHFVRMGQGGKLEGVNATFWRCICFTG